MIRLLSGDCRDVLATLPDASVHTVVTSPPYYALRSYLDAGHADKHREIGSEATPDEYLATMVQVFREVRRVLRPDGTCWVNIGDSYVSSASGAVGATSVVGRGTITAATARPSKSQAGKAKDLLLMPARLALALQADGWWVRSDIIWHKPNPMPESVTDRCVSAHEHVFMLTKSARYFFDADAIREDGSGRSTGNRTYKYDGVPGHETKQGILAVSDVEWHNRACRNVWTIATHAYSAAHFATYPPELASRCIRAGTSERGCCAQCGAPWRRQGDVSYEALGGNSGRTEAVPGVDGKKWNGGGYPRMSKHTTTTGWSPSCTHNAAVVPATVLDPFFGAGTTGLVASRLQRDCIGIDLNPDYNYMSRERIEADAPLFAAFPVADPAEARQAELWAEPLAAD